jgi:anaerobic selenocysteine-containing dehydrogenase
MINRIGTCSKDCYGSCVFTGEWNDDAQEHKFFKAKPLKSHPFTNGFFCEKLTNRESLVYHAKRLIHPLIRVGEKGDNRFETISLNKTLHLITEKIKETILNFGTQSIIGAYNAGNTGLLSRLAPLRFFGKLGATITTGGICNEGGCAGLTNLFGTYSTTNPLQLSSPNTHLIINWGSDVANRNSHAYFLIKKAIKEGARLISIDSRRTTSFTDSDQSIRLDPGMDHLLAQIILKKLVEVKVYDRDFLIENTLNYENILLEIDKIDIKKILSRLKIKFSEIKGLIDLIIEHKHHTILNIGYGVQKELFGGQIVQIIALIQILLGNIGKPGTGIIYSQSDFNKPILKPLVNYITQKRLYNQLKEIKLIKLGRELSKDKYKMLFIYNFNPVSSLPNQNQLKKCLLRNDLFVVVQELFLTETTRYADIVIPSKFDIESHDLFAPYYVPGISINQAGPCPYDDCLTNYEFYQRLSFGMDWKNITTFQEKDSEIVEKCLNLLPNNLRNNVKTKGYHILFKKDDIPFQNLLFPTTTGKIELKNISLNFGLEHLNEKLQSQSDEFLLITPSYKYFLHSQLGQINNSFLKVFKKIYLNPIDIKKLKLKIGRLVKVSNDLGFAIYILEGFDAVKPGVALIYSGTPMGLPKSYNPNIFIPDKAEQLGCSGVYNSAIVKVEKIL